MSRWKEIVWEELKQIFRLDPRRALFLFGAALAYSIIFGVLYYPGVVRHVPCVVYDQEQTHFSRSLVRQFEDSDSLYVTAYASSEEEMQQALRDKTAYAAIDIPPDFSKQIKTGRSSNVLLIINGSNIILTNTISSAAQDIIAAFSDAEAVRRAALRTGLAENLLQKRISPVTCHLRVLNNPTQSYMMFFVLGLAMAAFQQGLFLAVGASIQYEYARAQNWRWQGTSLHAILALKMIVYWLLGVLSFAMIILTVQYALGIFNQAPLWQLFALGGAFSFTAIALAMMASAWSRTEAQFVRASIMYTVPAFIFGGYTWPLESMGTFAGTLANIFPMAWLSNAVRSLFLSGHTYGLYKNILVLLIMGCVFLAGLYYPFARRMKAAKNNK